MEKLPALQGLQAVAVSAPRTLEAVPPGQALQDEEELAPVVVRKVPVEHGVQVMLPWLVV